MIPKTRTHFEQVPLHVVWKAIEEELKREESNKRTGGITKKSLEDALPAAKAQ